MAKIIEKIVVDTSEHDKKLKQAKKALRDYGQEQKAMQAVVSGITSAVSKFAGGLGLAMTALDGFNRLITATEGGADALARTQMKLTGAVDSFFYHISQGDFSGFINGLNEVIENAGKAYDAVDRLGTLQAFNSRGRAELDASDMKARATLRNKNASEEAKKAAREQIKANNEARRLLTNEEIKQANKAYNETLKGISKDIGVPVSVLDKAARSAKSFTYYTEGVDELKRKYTGKLYTLSQDEQDKWKYGKKIADVEQKLVEANKIVEQALQVQQSYSSTLASNNRITTTGISGKSGAKGKPGADAVVKLDYEFLHGDPFEDIPKKLEKEPLRLKIVPATEDFLEELDQLRESDELRQLAENAAKVREQFEFTTSAISGMGTSLSEIGKNVNMPALNVMGTIAQAIATMIMGYAAATEQAAKFGPVAWAAFGLSGLAELTAIISSVKSMGAFANGGIISGPTLGLMGEYAGAATNPEVVAPLNKLKSIIGDSGAGGGGTVEFRIQGKELVGILDKQNRINSRNR